MKTGIKLAGTIAGVVMSGVIVAACTAVVVDDRPPPPRPDRPQACTMQYDPVCGERRGDRQTFGNSCEADRAGYRIVHGGECRRGGPGMGGPGRPGPGGPGMGGPRPDRPDRPQFCTREYAPVCARQGRQTRTFGNSCEAEAAGYRIVRRGEC